MSGDAFLKDNNPNKNNNLMLIEENEYQLLKVICLEILRLLVYIDRNIYCF